MSVGNIPSTDIIIVDDDENVRQILELILSEGGYHTHPCASGAQAIELAQKQSTSLILLDVLMPDMDGFETCERLKANPDTRDIPVIFLTGLTSAEKETRGFDIGGIDYIYKPINPSIVLARIKTHLELKRYRDSLEDLVEERTERLNQTLIELSQSHRVKDKFLSLINHELRTPLNGMKGALQLLEDIDVSKESKGLLEIADQSLSGLTELVENILILTEAISSTLKPVNETFCSRESFLPTIERAQAWAKLKGLDFSFEIEDNVPATVQSDPCLLNRILMHFLSNGVRFTTSGKVSLNISMRQGDTDTGHLIFRVTDTGMGLSAEKQAIIGTQFSHASNVESRQFDGLGIGLSVCKSILALMDGTLSLSSELDKGSSFIADVPVRSIASDEADIANAERTLKAERDGSAQKTILVVEDNTINRIVAKQIVKKCGHQVLTACDGEEALQALARTDVDLILMDCQMPRMDGYETTEFIRAKEDQGMHLPIIAVTANATAANRKHCKQVGMDDYIPKPLSMDALVFKLSKWLA